jgi:hypothetical protein
MSKLGYDETNFTDAIVDLGKCENENKDLKRQILELKQTIKDLNVYKQEIENLLHNSRINASDKERLSQLLDKDIEIKDISIERLTKPIRIGNASIQNNLPSDFVDAQTKSTSELREFRGYGGKKYRTKRIKNKKNKSRRLKCKKV